MTEAPIRATQAARWPHGLAGRRPFAASAGAALLLHIIVCSAVLTIVHVPAPPAAQDDQTVEMVFAPPQAEPAEAAAATERAAPAAPEQPPAPIETPPPPDVPAEPAPPPPPVPIPVPEPPPAPAIEKPKPAVVAPPRPPIVRKAVPNTRPAARSAPAETAVTSQTAPQEAPVAGPLQPDNPASGAWQQSIATWLAGHKTYPHLARQRGIEGVVALRFTADRAGHVLSVEVVRSAGSTTLDEAAEAILRDATVPPFPPDMAQDKATVTVQIRYELAK